MPNPYYNRTLDVLPGSKITSQDIEDQFALVEAGFTNFNSYAVAAIALKGAIAGQAWTGSHDFTGATITVPTQLLTDDSTKAASTAWAKAYLAQQIASVNAGAAFLLTQRVNVASVTGVVGTDYECRYATGPVTITVPVPTVDRQAFGVTTLNGQNNVVDFGTAVVRGPLGTQTGLVTMDFLNPIFRWDATNNEWSAR